MDFAKLLHGFVKFVVWICQICSVDLSKLFFFSPFAKENQAEVWSTFWSSLTGLKSSKRFNDLIPLVCCVFGNFLTKRILTNTLNAMSYLKFWLESLNLFFSGKKPGLCWSPFLIKSLANFKKKASVDDKNSLNDNHRLKNTSEALKSAYIGDCGIKTTILRNTHSLLMSIWRSKYSSNVKDNLPFWTLYMRLVSKYNTLKYFDNLVIYTFSLIVLHLALKKVPPLWYHLHNREIKKDK